MKKYNDLDVCNDDDVHYMWVDYNYTINTGESPYAVNNTYIDSFVENLKDWD